MKQKCDAQDVELKKSYENARQAVSFAEEESSKCRVTRELVKSVAKQVFYFTEYPSLSLKLMGLSYIKGVPGVQVVAQKLLDI